MGDAYSKIGLMNVLQQLDLMCWTIDDVSFDISLSSIGLDTDVMNVVFPGDMFITNCDPILENQF